MGGEVSRKRRKCKQCGRNRAARFFVSQAARVCSDCKRKNRQQRARKTHLQRTYGITQEQYDELLEFQGGVCAICGGERRYNLAVDHDHGTGRVRGLLCKRCNKRLLPAALDSPDLLLAAAAYLQFPPADRVRE